jgi:PTS system mannose-specific IID component
MAEKKLTSGDMFSAFVRSNFLQGSWNFERMQALGYCFGMVPIIKRLYEGEERKQAIKRHLEFYNTQPFVTAPILGITAAMEEQRANGKDIPDSVINGIKVGMMGPLAGVGDPIFWGTLRPMTAALGASVALSGSLLGPIIFFVLFNLVRLGIRWYGIKYGYNKGTDVVKDVAGNKLQKITEGASILGLFVMGALVCKWTSVNIPFVISEVAMQDGTTKVTTIQSILNDLLPGLIPLLLTFVCMDLLKKKVNALWIIFGLFAVGIIGYALGIMK